MKGSAYRDLFLSSHILATTVGGLSLSAYRNRHFIQTRKITFCASLLRGATLAYMFGFCMVSDSPAFYKHIYSLQIRESINLDANVSKHYVVVSDESEAISKRDPILVEDK